MDTTGMTANPRQIDFYEHCADCGGDFHVDGIAAYKDNFRVHLSVHNTGEHGRMSLHLDGSRALVFNQEQAEAWTRRYPSQRVLRAPVDMSRSVTEQVFFHPASAGLPSQLESGERWEGWLETSGRPLHPEATALVLAIGPYRLSDSDRDMFWFTTDDHRPFASLIGEEVRVRPLGVIQRFFVRLWPMLGGVLLAFFAVLVGQVVARLFFGEREQEPVMLAFLIVVALAVGVILPRVQSFRRS